MKAALLTSLILLSTLSVFLFPQTETSFIIYKTGNYAAAVGMVTRWAVFWGDPADVIQACINRGSYLFINAGNYSLSHGLSITKYVKIEGVGHGVQYAKWGTVLKQRFDGTVINATFIDKNRSGFEIVSLQIEGGKLEGFTGSGVYVEKAKGWLVEDVYIRLFSDHALRTFDCGWHTLDKVFAGGCNKEILYFQKTVDFVHKAISACTVGNRTHRYDAALYLGCGVGMIIAGHFESGDYGRDGLRLSSCKRMSIGPLTMQKCFRAPLHIGQSKNINVGPLIAFNCGVMEVTQWKNQDVELSNINIG